MNARNKSRFRPKQAGWIAVAIFAAWLVFLLVPAPRKAKPPASTELPPMAAQSKLESVGLTNNPDWQGLPGYFAIWADSVEWVGGKTRFAYWNPGSFSYSYFFEAARGNSEIRFRAISARDAGVGDAPLEGGLFLDEEELAQYAEARKADSPTHPFVFSQNYVPIKPGIIMHKPAQPVYAPAVQSPKRPDAESKK